MSMTDRCAAGDPFAPLAQAYEDWFATPLGRFIDRAEMSALDSVLPEPGNGAIVEIGAGTGHVARHLAALGFPVIAIEPSSAMRNAGRQRSEGLDIEWCDATAEALPLAHDTVDGAVFFAALEFVRDPQLALREALRVVRPGGWLIVALLHALSPWAALYRRLAEEGQAPWPAARFFTPEDPTRWIGAAPRTTVEAVYLAPGAKPPFQEADEAGRRAGNAPAMQVLLWRKSG